MRPGRRGARKEILDATDATDTHDVQ